MSVQPATQVAKLNPANVFTAARLPMAVLGFYVFASGHKLLGISIIVFAAWTDFFDGVVARRFNCVSEFGAKFDPIVDKIFQVMVIAFTFSQLNNAMAFVLLGLILEIEVALAAIAIYALRRNFTVRVSWTGKKGMFARMMCVTWLLAGTIGTTTFYSAISIIGSSAGVVVGVVLGQVTWMGYLAQWRASDAHQTNQL